ncbi:MAG: hypothetical protein ACO2ZZ_07225 [Cyclobacteriaceae bacterium]|jgi:hypothetical protein
MSITFEDISIRITKYDAGLIKAGWFIGNVAKARRAVIDGHKTVNVFLDSRNSANDCEAAIGKNCELLRLG